MKKVIKTLKIGVIIILAIIFMMLLTIFIKGQVNKEKYPDLFGYKSMIVLSGSMEPTIMKGDLIIVKKVDSKDLKAKDIIAFRNEDKTITSHRIINVDEIDSKLYFKTKGDNNNTMDEGVVVAKDIEGIYVSRIPELGDFLMYIQTTQGFITVTMILLFMFFIYYFISNKIEEKKNKEEQLKNNEKLKEYEENEKEFQEYLKNKKNNKKNDKKDDKKVV